MNSILTAAPIKITLAHVAELLEAYADAEGASYIAYVDSDTITTDEFTFAPAGSCDAEEGLIHVDATLCGVRTVCTVDRVAKVEEDTIYLGTTDGELVTLSFTPRQVRPKAKIASVIADFGN